MRRLTAVQMILVGAFMSMAPGHGPTTPAAQSTQTIIKLNEAERALVAGSRTAIVRSGMSSAYFDRHFTLVQVVNRSGDRRVVWSFSVNEYATTVTDVLGYYTANGKRRETHSVTATLGATSEIKRTISRKTADRLMQKCIGSFANPSVEYRAAGNGPARLLLTAEAIPKLSPPQNDEPPKSSPKAQVQTDMDVIRDKRRNRPPIIVASIDLESGKCTKGELLAGPRVPASQF